MLLNSLAVIFLYRLKSSLNTSCSPVNFAAILKLVRGRTNSVVDDLYLLISSDSTSNIHALLVDMDPQAISDK